MTKEEKIYLVVETFLKHPNLTISELANLPELKDISKSSIQRYLNDPIISQIFNENLFNSIKDRLKLKTIEARKKGGLMSFRNNNALKDANGKFIGVEKSGEDNNIKRKIKHILFFTQVFLENPNFTLQDIADLYNKINPTESITRDYVYDCLSEHDKYDLFSNRVSNLIASQLEQRRLLGNKNGAEITNENRGKR